MLEARDERGLAVCGRELCQTEFVRDSKVGLSLSIPLQTASGLFPSSIVKAPLFATFWSKDLKRFFL